MALAPGTRLGPYEILSLLGTGGMGEVFKATDTRLGRTVAIKTLAHGQAQRFQQEARAIAALSHPHICVLHDVGPDYFVMEYLEGNTLQGPLPLDQAIHVASQVADALEAAHAKGILHRDLKPTNIMMTRAGAKLLDFGLAKLVAEGAEDATQTRAGTVLGTAAYMSPEQAQGRPTDARSDIFSFGAVLYELLSGRRAFDGASMFDTLSAVINNEPPPLASPAADVLRRCLAKQPGHRFQTMADLRAALRQVGAGAGRAQSGASIAVLPFANMSHDADDEYFSDGLAEEIINALAQVPDLKVIARTSAFAFKGKNEDIRRIAEALGVATVLEGSVRRVGSRIRVMAQLIKAADGTHLWSQRYDREMADVFEVQDDISTAIASALKLTLVPVPARRMPSVPAYEAYLRYRSHQWKFTPEASQRSRECLEQALALDPDFALPYVGLADYHLALGIVGLMPAQQAMPRARELAERALQLEPELAEAHAMLGIVAGHYDFDWREAERRFRLATAREPISGHLRQWHASFFLLATGRVEESLRENSRVIEDDPLCQIWHNMAFQSLLAMGRNEDALAAIQRAVDIDPTLWIGWANAGTLHAIDGRHAEALACAEKALGLAPWNFYTMGLMAGALANLGEAEKAQPLLATLRADTYVGPAGLAIYHLARHEPEQALQWAQQAVEQRFPAYFPNYLRPFESQLRQSPAWLRLLKTANLA